MNYLKNIAGRIKSLENMLTGDLFGDADLREEIHRLKLKIKSINNPATTKPDESDFECIGCGS